MSRSEYFQDGHNSLNSLYKSSAVRSTPLTFLAILVVKIWMVRCMSLTFTSFFFTPERPRALQYSFSIILPVVLYSWKEFEGRGYEKASNMGDGIEEVSTRGASVASFESS